jgi:hypothetical protein
MDDGVDPAAADPTLERREIGDVRDAEIGVPIEIRAIPGGEIVDDHDVVATCEERVDDVAAEKTRAACHEDTQLPAAPLPRNAFRWLVVDELVEEMVDKRPTRRSVSTLAFHEARWASAATRSERRPPIPIRTPVLDLRP